MIILAAIKSRISGGKTRKEGNSLNEAVQCDQAEVS